MSRDITGNETTATDTADIRGQRLANLAACTEAGIASDGHKTDSLRSQQPGKSTAQPTRERK